MTALWLAPFKLGKNPTKQYNHTVTTEHVVLCFRGKTEQYQIERWDRATMWTGCVVNWSSTEVLLFSKTLLMYCVKAPRKYSSCYDLDVENVFLSMHVQYCSKVW